MWLTLGNVFISYPNLSKWYGTGVLGGSLWILIINVLLYRFLVFKTNERYFNSECNLLNTCAVLK